MKKVILLLIVTLAMQACSKRLDSASLVNTKWELSEWPGRTLPVGGQATLNFDADNKIGGKSFCNSYGGNSAISDNTVKFEQIFSTKMFCSEFSAAETNYHADLLTINSLKMEGSKLQLLKDGQVVMVFVKK
jgi:heat shock protein HslJ